MFRILFCLLMIIVLQGCATILSFNGPAKLADPLFPAQTDGMRTLRAYTFMAGAAQVGATKFAKNPAGIGNFLEDYRGASGELKEISNCRGTPQTCPFEVAMRGYYHQFKKVAGHLVSKEAWKQIASTKHPIDFFENPAAIKTIVSNGLAAGGDIGAVYREAANLRMDIALETLEKLELEKTTDQIDKTLETLEPNDEKRSKYVEKRKKYLLLIALRKQLIEARAKGEREKWDYLIYQVELKPQPHHYERVLKMLKMTCRRMLKVQDKIAGVTNPVPQYSKCFGPEEDFIKSYKSIYAPKADINVASVDAS